MLVVEDHDALRRSLHEWIQAIFPDCSVVEARSGEEAVVNAPLFLPAIILMDVGLPGMSGIEATRRLRALLPTARIVMLTILESDAYRTEAAAAGACAFVTKRHMQSELLPVLGALARAVQCADARFGAEVCMSDSATSSPFHFTLPVAAHAAAAEVR